MLARIGYYWTVRVAAWGLRKGLEPGELLDSVRAAAHPRHDPAWHMQVVDDAAARNEKRLARR